MIKLSRLGIRGLGTSAVRQANENQQKLYDSHIPLTNLQRVLLAAGSSLTAIVDPYRHDMVADFGETTGHQALGWMRKKMLETEEGRAVLEERPRLNSKSVNYEQLARMAENTLGYQYSRFYVDNQVSPDTRKEVQFVDDPELAYVMQRYRELHDIMHTILRQPTNIKGEIMVKAFEAVQTRLPLCILGALVGPLKLSIPKQLEYFRHDLPRITRSASQCKFLMGIYFERRFEQDIEELRREVNLSLLEDS